MADNTDMTGAHDVVIVGGGIVGLATARALMMSRPGLRIALLEKESDVGSHQTGHNSGVVHAGIYYEPGSLKARLCLQGRATLRDFARDHDIAYEECGKVIVARDATEADRLNALYERGIANGVPGLELIDAARLRTLEPHARGVAAVWSPSTAITDYPAIARALAADLRDAGALVRTGAHVVALDQHSDGVRVGLRDGSRIDAGVVVTCAGLWSDTVARLSGDTPEPRIVPFRGDYYRLSPGARGLVRGLIYPVPDPRYPFLGVHLTRTVSGEVLVGPNASLAFARDGYRMRRIDPAGLARTLAWRGFRRFARVHWRTGVQEIRRSVSRAAFAREARAYVPELRDADLVRAVAGVRAQAMTGTGDLVDDFRITRAGKVINVRNAPSPAATSSLAIGEEIVARLEL